MMEFSFKWTTRIFIFVTCLLNGIGVLDMSVVAENMNSCPSPRTPAWEERSVLVCYDRRGLDPSRYHCLQNQSGVFKEICTEAILIQKGSFPKWSDAGKQIYQELCPPGTYQEVSQMSNKFNMCRNKSKCTEDGQLASHCPDGGTTADQQCRCDYKRGYVANYYAFINEMNKSCFFPREVENKCTILNTCPDTDELNPAYRCVKKCPTGYIRPEMEFECVKISSMKSTPPPTTVTTTTQESSTSARPMDPENREDEWYKHPGFIVLITVIVLLSVVIPVSVSCVRNRNGHRNCFGFMCGHETCTCCSCNCSEYNNHDGSEQIGNNNIVESIKGNDGEDSVAIPILNGNLGDNSSSQQGQGNHGDDSLSQEGSGNHEEDLSSLEGQGSQTNVNEPLLKKGNETESKEKEEAKWLHQNIQIELRKFLYKSEDGIQSDVLRDFKLRAKGVGAHPWAVDDRKTDAADVFKSLEEVGKISLGNYEVLFQIIEDQATTAVVRQITEQIQNLLHSQE